MMESIWNERDKHFFERDGWYRESWSILVNNALNW